ncbi:hypothetical protein M758_9G072300 [Ceratodon purpureus]|nr:hypothetical protein M758_9G072300 [Ceratodon purpureus]
MCIVYMARAFPCRTSLSEDFRSVGVGGLQWQGRNIEVGITGSGELVACVMCMPRTFPSRSSLSKTLAASDVQ